MPMSWAVWTRWPGVASLPPILLFSAEGSCVFQDQRPGSVYSGALPGWLVHLGTTASNAEVDPLLAADGTLLAGSPAIGAGQPLALVRYDIDGQLRGDDNDIGADQR
jgi:hypothetical protein